MKRLKVFNLVYLGTPYTGYPHGHEMAFIEACKIASRLITAGVNIYSPIAHTHPIAIHGILDHLDYKLWLNFDSSMMRVADAFLIAKMEKWDHSFGLAHETAYFKSVSKPIYHIDPDTMIVERGDGMPPS